MVEFHEDRHERHVKMTRRFEVDGALIIPLPYSTAGREVEIHTVVIEQAWRYGSGWGTRILDSSIMLIGTQLKKDGTPGKQTWSGNPLWRWRESSNEGYHRLLEIITEAEKSVHEVAQYSFRGR